MQSKTRAHHFRLRINSRRQIIILVLLLTLFEAASSQAHMGRGRMRGHSFPPMAQWHSGYWFHGAYLERNGWWWVAGPNWYYYNAPVYPYPPMGAEPVYVVSSVYARPPAANPPLTEPQNTPPLPPMN